MANPHFSKRKNHDFFDKIKYSAWLCGILSKINKEYIIKKGKVQNFTP
jgi:hypothetical protein